LQPTNFSSTFNFKNVETVHILPESEIIAGKHRSKWTPCTQDKKLIICYCENYHELSLFFCDFNRKTRQKFEYITAKLDDAIFCPDYNDDRYAIVQSN